MSVLYEALKKWHGDVEIDGKVVSEDDFVKLAQTSLSSSSIILHANKQDSSERKVARVESSPEYRIVVKSYMTKKATPGFDFMAKWNNNIPMPLLTMVGTVEKETPGMVYMKLHGDITGHIETVCMKCGKPITNPVSQYFGLGPMCGHHNYVNPFNTEEELKSAISDYRRNYLQKIVWEGWIIKSAIIRKEEMNNVASI